MNPPGAKILTKDHVWLRPFFLGLFASFSGSETEVAKYVPKSLTDIQN